MARKILLADDSVTAQNMGRKILTDAGYEVIAVNNGSAALKKIVEHKPDLIVLDVYMPGYSGLEVCQRIKDNRETARIPVLLTVGKLEPFKPEEARRARADAFVVKPFEASELLSALGKLEEKIGPQPEPYKQGRFAKAIASLDEPENTGTDKFGDSDSGWKSRLRFPGRKKASDPGISPEKESPEIASPAKAFRDFREESKPSPVSAHHPALQHDFERPMPAGIPRDITPEEIAAISAAAARLSAPAPAESEAKLEVVTPEGVPHEAATPLGNSQAEVTNPPANQASQSPAPAPAEFTSSLEPSPVQDAGPVTFASAPVVEEQAEAQATSVQPGESRPAELVKAAPEAVAAPSDPVPFSASALAETSSVVPAASTLSEPTSAQLVAGSSEPSLPVANLTPTAQVPDSVSTPLALSAIQQDASAPVPAETHSAAASNLPAEGEMQPPIVSTNDAQASAQTEPVASSIPAEAVATVSSSTAEVALASDISVPVASVAPVAHDDEVMAALQNLIPSAGAANGSSAPTSNPNFAAALEEFASTPPTRPRWIAEEAILTAEETVLSLEHEMERAYAAFAASEAARLLTTSPTDSLRPRFAAPAALIGNPPIAEPSISSALPVAAEPDGTRIEAQAPHEEVVATALPVADIQPIAVSTAEIATEVPTAARLEDRPEDPSNLSEDQAAIASVSAPPPDPVVVLQTDAKPFFESSPSSSPDAPDAVIPSAAPAVTNFVVAASPLSDPVSQSESASAALQTAVPVEPEAVAAHAASISETISAGDEDMAKNSELGFKMIRQSPAGSKAAASTVTKENFEGPAKSDEPAKTAEPVAMAAAASAETASVVPPMPASAPDPRAIASIVDSVLAELRPKIVEEIAKKLADKK